MGERVLLDTGPLVAILSEADEHHDFCVAQIRKMHGRLVTCWPVITEAAWLLRRYPVAVERLLASLNGGPYELAELGEGDLAGIGTILARYRDLGAQLADATLVHLANREGIGTVFTLDRRDFSVMRRARGRRLRLIP
jgi:hypothetical protein